ncbi:leucyl/phenylalanyl-tRNA--protein transferase [Thermopirellula anaerolimosa]
MPRRGETEHGPHLPPSRFFPPAETATPEGAVALGGDLRPEILLDAYAHGIFPWPIDERSPIVWASPDPRGVFEFDRIHIPRRLMRLLRQGRFHVTCDRDFAVVMRGCASAGDRVHGTWITPAMVRAYIRLHRLGFAHSVEVWDAGRLAGGVYGVALAGLFAAESMFYVRPNASKVGLLHLLYHLQARGYRLVDIQMLTPVTQSLGAREISRAEYLKRLAAALQHPADFGTEPDLSSAPWRGAQSAVNAS